VAHLVKIISPMGSGYSDSFATGSFLQENRKSTKYKTKPSCKRITKDKIKPGCAFKKLGRI
jgi:hypothetical protein